MYMSNASLSDSVARALELHVERGALRSFLRPEPGRAYWLVDTRTIGSARLNLAGAQGLAIGLAWYSRHRRARTVAESGLAAGALARPAAPPPLLGRSIVGRAVSGKRSPLVPLPRTELRRTDGKRAETKKVRSRPSLAGI